MAVRTAYDPLVIGTGPGGYVCAIRAAQLGLKVPWSRSARRSAAPASTSAASPRRRCWMPPSCSRRRGQASRPWASRWPRRARPAEMMAFKDEGVKGNSTASRPDEEEQDRRLPGHGARIVGPGKVGVALADGGRQQLEAKSIVIATGSDVAQLPGVHRRARPSCLHRRPGAAEVRSACWWSAPASSGWSSARSGAGSAPR